MTRTLALTSLLPLLLLATPASAISKEQKMETCKFGADDQKLDGAKRKTFMSNCMANRDDKRPTKPAASMAPAPKQ
jgi:hypothetical protein